MLSQDTRNYPKPVSVGANLGNWICQHQLSVFFTLTFVFSWSIFLGVALSEFSNQTTLSRLLLIAGFSPSLSALLVSRINSPKNVTPKPWKQVFLFLLIFAFGAAVEWLDHILWKHQVDFHLIVIDTALISLAAFVVSSVYSRRQKVRETIIPITGWRVDMIWYLVALGLWPLLIFIGNVFANVMDLPLSKAPDWPARTLLFAIPEYLIWFLLFGGPLNEEPGWRGFALPRLQYRFSPLVASLVLGTFWGLWHVPLHLMGIYHGGAWGAIIRIQELPRAVLFTWIYNRTKGSLLLTILFHAAINTAGFFLPRSFSMLFATCTLGAIIIVVKERMWERLPIADNL